MRCQSAAVRRIAGRLYVGAVAREPIGNGRQAAQRHGSSASFRLAEQIITINGWRHNSRFNSNLQYGQYGKDSQQSCAATTTTKTTHTTAAAAAAIVSAHNESNVRILGRTQQRHANRSAETPNDTVGRMRTIRSDWQAAAERVGVLSVSRPRTGLVQCLQGSQQYVDVLL